MARFLVAIFVIVHSVAGHSDTVIAAGSSLPALPERVPFSLTCRRTADDEQSLSGLLDLSEHGQFWQPSDDAFTSIGKNWQLRGDWHRDDAQLRVSLRYECQGREDPKRRFCFETRALDKDGKLLVHDWQVEGDNLIGPTEIPEGSVTFVRSRLNSTNNRLNGPALRRLARLDFRLTEMPDGMPPHFPAAPHKLNLAVTRPDKCGRFDVTFTNRAGWDLEPAKHEIAFQVFVYDSKRKLVRADRRFLLYREDGCYRARVCVERKYYDYSKVSITIFTRQPDNDKFIREFFFGGGSSYHGMWTGDGGQLMELPLKNHPLFDDLPEQSALADE